jgi:hypothetical protein
MTKVKFDRGNRISQGDVLRNIRYIENVFITEDGVEISFVYYPYVIVLTQDCDLEQDSNIRLDPKDNKIRLLSILVAPLYNEEHFFMGNHLSNLEFKGDVFSKNKTPYDRVRQNNDSRYHFLQFEDDVTVPNSVIDFKHYFSIDVAEYSVKIEKHYVCCVKELYREQISHRFSYYLSRIGLPTKDNKE